MSRAMTIFIVAAFVAVPVQADIPFAQSEIWSGPQFREKDARRERLENRAEELQAQIERAQTEEDKTVIREELAGIEEEWTRLTKLPEEMSPAYGKMLARMDEIGSIPGRFDPEPITVEEAEMLSSFFHEPSFGYAKIDARWHSYLLGEMTWASAHPDLSPEAAEALRNGYVEYSYAMSQYYAPDEIMVSIDVMAEMAEGLLRSAQPDDKEARDLANHLTERVLTWTGHLQRHEERAMYNDILGGLQETSLLLEESAPDWLEEDLSHPKAKALREMVSQTKKAARRDNRNLKRIQDVVVLGQADFGRPDWNDASTRMQLILIRRILTKSRKTVSVTVVSYLGEVLRQYPNSGKLTTKELKTLWLKAVDVLFRRAETLKEVKANKKLVETDFSSAVSSPSVTRLFLRSYFTILRKSPRLVRNEVVRHIDQNLLDLGRTGKRLVSKEHWILWGRAVGSLGKDRASKEIKRFVYDKTKTEKNPMRLNVHKRTWRSIKGRSKKVEVAPRPPTTAPASRAA